MNCRKMLTAFVAVAGLVCANTAFAEAQIGVKAEKESAIGVWLSTLLSGGAKAKGGRAEPPECYDRNGRAIYSAALCERLALEEANPYCLRFPPGQCRLTDKPGVCRGCTGDPDPGP
jgi:hypothetical protein